MLVEHTVGAFTELLHICANEHLAEGDEVAVGLIVDLDDAPRVCTTANGASVRSGDVVVGPDDGKRDLALCIV